MGSPLRSALFLLLALFPFISNAQSSHVEWLSGDGVSAPIRLRFYLGEYSFKNVATENGVEQVLLAKGGTPILQAGAPDLPKFTSSVIIPDQVSYEVHVVNDNAVALNTAYSIAPSLGNIKRDVDPSSLTRQHSTVYAKNQNFPFDKVELRTPHILRDFRGQTVVFYPFQYNPVLHTLTVSTQIDVELTPVAGIQAINPLVRQHEPLISTDDQQVYAQHFVNYDVARYTGIPESLKMLIISDPSFIADLEPLILWKRQSGIEVEVITLAQAGGNAAGISAAISARYQSTGLSYVLLVGDLAQIPSPTAFTGKSDPTYGFVLGDDTYPEVIVGRLSAENTTHVQTQVSKIVQYEKAQLPSAHLSHFLAMASDQGPGDDNEYDWEHERLMRTKLSAYTYSTANELYDGSQGELDPAGNPTPANVSSVINQGIGLLNYTGHGSATSFGTSGFSNTQINQLQNDGMLPFIWSVGCVNGEFDNGTCFGEAWMRATRNGQLTGAVATYMSSINQSWDPPMAAQDEMVDLLTEEVQTSTTRTFGGLCLNGSMKMNDDYGTAGDEMTATWHIFGDPSMMVRTAVPLSMTVTHAPSTILGTLGFLVNVDVENARVAISQNGNLLGVALVEGGQAWVSFEALTQMDSLLVTVTAFNRIPYQGMVAIENPADAFLLIDQHQFSQTNGNDDALVDEGESFILNVDVKNVGGLMAHNALVSVSCSSPFITLNAVDCQLGEIDINQIQSTSSCFSFTVADDVVDQSIAHFIIQLSDSTGASWSQPLDVVIQAPKLNVSSFQFVELTGNGNGRPDAGETIQITLQNNNIGHSMSATGNGHLSVNVINGSIANPDYTMSAVDAGNAASSNYTVTIDANVPAGAYVPFQYTWSAGAYSANLNFTMHVGVVMEDAESGDFSQFNWQNTSSIPWTIDLTTVYEGSTSFRSGQIGNNASTSLSINYEVAVNDTLRFMRRVSSEDGYDYLRFFLDGNEVNAWTGVQEWTQEKVAVTAGTHQFEWMYEKDSNVGDNEDAAWVDNIEFPPAVSTVSTGAVINADAPTFVISPNPASATFSLSAQHLQLGTYRFCLMDVSGRIIERKSMMIQHENGKWMWERNAAAAGLYFMHILGPDGKSTQLKLILAD